MGTKFGPSFACLFMGHLEQQVFDSYTGTKPDFFKRYIDDCIGAASCSVEEIQDFIDFFGNFHPAIKLTSTISDSHVPFLDIALSIADDDLSTSVYYKPTDAHTYYPG